MRIERIKLVTELARRDMTQKRLAELSGVSRATINYIRKFMERTAKSRIRKAYLNG